MSSEMTLILTLAASITVVVGAVFAIKQLVSPIFKRLFAAMAAWENFMMDWAGTRGRDGRDGDPGVMERLNKIDGQLSNNGGSSLKDAVDRIEDRIEKSDKKFQLLEKRIAKLEEDEL
jgi:hypothetical protein